jgi:NhaP-type Na+/H+ or K+/H+ antiporter
MELINPYSGIIVACTILVLCFLSNRLAKIYGIPSVILLIMVGIGIRFALDYFEISVINNLMGILVNISMVGVILVVLEGSLKLEITRVKRPLIVRSFFLALFSMIACISLITWLLNRFVLDDLFTSVLYSVPLSVVSSATIIPNIGNLMKKNRESLIHESTFSDIIGIIIFFYLIRSLDKGAANEVILKSSVNLIITVFLSVFTGYLMVILLEKLRSQFKLFLLIAVLILLYSLGILFDLSSMILILFFGLMLTNSGILFPGKLKRWIKTESLKKIQNDFYILTKESVFFLGTFFFVVFGITLELTNLINVKSLLVSLGIVTGIFLIRLVSLKIFMARRLFPELLVAPRGLITLLLFFSIPGFTQNTDFNSGIVFYVIVITTIVMSVSLMIKGEDREFAEKLNFRDWDELDKEIEQLTKEAP